MKRKHPPRTRMSGRRSRHPILSKQQQMRDRINGLERQVTELKDRLYSAESIVCAIQRFINNDHNAKSYNRITANT